MLNSYPFFTKTKKLKTTEDLIKIVLEKITHLKLAKSHLQKLDARLLEAYQEMADLESKMDKEFRDVELLQNSGTVSYTHLTLPTICSV